MITASDSDTAAELQQQQLQKEEQKYSDIHSLHVILQYYNAHVRHNDGMGCWDQIKNQPALNVLPNFKTVIVTQNWSIISNSN